MSRGDLVRLDSAVLVNVLLGGGRPHRRGAAPRSYPQHRNTGAGWGRAALWGARESRSEGETHCPFRQNTWNCGRSCGSRSPLQCPSSSLSQVRPWWVCSQLADAFIAITSLQCETLFSASSSTLWKHHLHLQAVLPELHWAFSCPLITALGTLKATEP